MSVTIRDVARRAGVSVSTASRALNNRDDVSEAVRRRVVTAARELHYTGNPHARALKGVTSKTLGVILYDTHALTFNANMTRGIYDVTTPQGYSVIVISSNGDAETERQAHQMLRAKRVDGLLINSAQSGAAPLQRLTDENIPFVLLNRRLDDLDCDYTMVNYRQGGYLATRYLLELGHRRILNQLGSRKHPPGHERLIGYRQALQEFGIPFEPELVIYSEKAFENHAHVLEAMLRLQPRPTAILAYNDESAIPVLKALSDLSLQVPDDVSVVGQNDLSFASYLIPPLTSVAHPIYEMGARGAEILLQKLAWPAQQPWITQHIVFEPKLTIRLSSSSPRVRQTVAV
ncbi:MAG: LacI family transcriptional regulator [Chloroflexi bacterium]|nr:MAG: LacI family transcriptional regulator [Chloroflexota bacterium]